MSPYVKFRTAAPKWVDVNCGKRNLVVCQKPYLWSLAQFQEIFKQYRKNPLPPGFIYVQLGGQPAPKTLWPFSNWQDVTSSYAGQFFRAQGGGSAAFGTVQAENAPRLTDVYSKMVYRWAEKTHTSLPVGGTSDYLWSGDDVGGINNFLTLTFKTSGGEVRPKNQAVRIWKRV
jgi:hypothetical protein